MVCGCAPSVDPENFPIGANLYQIFTPVLYSVFGRKLCYCQRLIYRSRDMLGLIPKTAGWVNFCCALVTKCGIFSRIIIGRKLGLGAEWVIYSIRLPFPVAPRFLYDH